MLNINKSSKKLVWSCLINRIILWRVGSPKHSKSLANMQFLKFLFIDFNQLQNYKTLQDVESLKWKDVSIRDTEDYLSFC
jgi:hypothetical protein